MASAAPLVWDQNVPAKKGESFTFPKVWHAGTRQKGL